MKNVTWNPETLVADIGWDGINKELTIEKFERQWAEAAGEELEFDHANVAFARIDGGVVDGANHILEAEHQVFDKGAFWVEEDD